MSTVFRIAAATACMVLALAGGYLLLGALAFAAGMAAVPSMAAFVSGMIGAVSPMAGTFLAAHPLAGFFAMLSAGTLMVNSAGYIAAQDNSLAGKKVTEASELYRPEMNNLAIACGLVAFATSGVSMLLGALATVMAVIYWHGFNSACQQRKQAVAARNTDAPALS